MNLDFYEHDLDLEAVNRAVQLEMQKLKHLDDRTDEQLYKAVYKGQLAEQYLIQYHDCINNNELYGDVITNNGIKLEVKVRRNYNLNSIIDSIIDYTPSTHIIVFQWYHGHIRDKGLFFKLRYKGPIWQKNGTPVRA